MTLYMFFFFPANSLGVGEGKRRNSPPMRFNLKCSSPTNYRKNAMQPGFVSVTPNFETSASAPLHLTPES